MIMKLIRDRRMAGMAIPAVIGLILVLAIAAVSIHVLLRQGGKQLSIIVDEIVLLNVAEAVLDKVVCHLKMMSWGNRWYREAGHAAFGGPGGVSSGDEQGVYINELGYDDLEYYYYIEDVRYRDYYGEADIPAGGNITGNDIVPHLARLYVQVTYGSMRKTVECELNFRESCRLSPTMVLVRNFKVISDPEKHDLSDGTGLQEIKAKGRRLFEKARDGRKTRSGLNDVVESHIRELNTEGSQATGGDVEQFGREGFNRARVEAEQEIAQHERAARKILEDFEVEKHNVSTSSAYAPDVSYSSIVDHLKAALATAVTQPTYSQQHNVPRCLFLLGQAFMTQGRMIAGAPIKSGINSTDPVLRATTPLCTDHGEQVWMGASPPASLSPGTGIADSDSEYSHRSYLFKLAESCFSTIINRYPASKYASKSYFKLYQVKLHLASRWGRAYAHHAARQVLKLLKQKVDTGAYPGFYRMFGEDYKLSDVCREVYRSSRKSRIAYSGPGRDGGRALYTRSTDGTEEPVMITGQGPGNYYPAWSPDGSQLAFISDRDGTARIYVTDADGSTPPSPITSPPEWYDHPTWSPDGGMIAARVRDIGLGGIGGDGDILVMNADGQGPRFNLTDTPSQVEMQPFWSPDGSQLGYVSGTTGGGGGGGQFSIQVLDIPEADSSSGPSQSGSGNPLLDLLLKPVGLVVDLVKNNVIGSGGSNLPLPLPPLPLLPPIPGLGGPPPGSGSGGNQGGPGTVRTIAEGYDVSWSPDGQTVTYVSGTGGAGTLYVARADGSSPPVALPNTPPGTSRSPVWSADGKQVAFLSDDGRTGTIYVINTDGTAPPRPVTEIQDVSPFDSLSWSPASDDPFPDIFDQ